MSAQTPRDKYLKQSSVMHREGCKELAYGSAYGLIALTGTSIAADGIYEITTGNYTGIYALGAGLLTAVHMAVESRRSITTADTHFQAANELAETARIANQAHDLAQMMSR